MIDERKIRGHCVGKCEQCDLIHFMLVDKDGKEVLSIAFTDEEWDWIFTEVARLQKEGARVN
jgi:hypothetical protein